MGNAGYNGDLGFITRIDPDAAEVVVDFEGREVVYDIGELYAVVPAYATTVHKTQGSEYPAVVIPPVTQHRGMLRRNLVYTAVTRGKRLVVVVGQPTALAIAVKGARARRRWSKLGEWLGGEEQPAQRPAAPAHPAPARARCAGSLARQASVRCTPAQITILRGRRVMQGFQRPAFQS